MEKRLMVVGIQHDMYHCLLTQQGLCMVAELLQERGRGYLVWLRVSAWYCKQNRGWRVAEAACLPRWTRWYFCDVSLPRSSVAAGT